jgi:pimeloyl-ACP methyl ester carboxylesterase
MAISTQTSTLLHHNVHANPTSDEWLLMIHGAGGSTRTWKRQIEDLSQHFNLLVIDLPGHGESAKTSDQHDSYTFDSISHLIWDVVEHHKIEKVHVLGVSLGAIIALNIETLYADRVKSFVLAGAIVLLNRKLKIVAESSLTLAKIIGYRRLYKVAARFMLPRRNHKTSRDMFIRESQFLSLNEFKKWTEMYHTLNATLQHLYAAATDVPRLLLMGEQDHLFLGPAMEYSSGNAYSTLEVVPKCGHVVNIERADAFNEACIRFVKGVVRG